MGKLGILVVAFALLGAVRCYNADVGGALGGLPVVGPMVAPSQAVPGYVSGIGTPAPAAPPETDVAVLFPANATDPYDAARWSAMRAFLATAGTQAGWAEVCKKAATAGAERASNPLVGALACSSDGSVTSLQRLAVLVLQAQAATALYIKDAPGSGQGAIQAFQGQLRVLCGDLVPRSGGNSGAIGTACAAALETAYVKGDAPATFARLQEAYAGLAAEIARLDPQAQQEPGYGAPATPTP